MKAPSSQKLADAYGVTRAQIYYLRKVTTLTRGEMADPQNLFNALLKRNRSQLRSRLSNPETRTQISQQLAQ